MPSILCLADTPQGRSLTQRERVLDNLLAHYREAEEMVFCRAHREAAPLHRRSRNPSGGPTEMPRVWNKSYRRLERLLPELRSAGRYVAVEGYAGLAHSAPYWHVKGWYWCPLVAKREHRVRRKGTRTYTELGGYQLVPRRHADVEAIFVRAGLVWLGDSWESFGSEPFFPADEFAA